MATVARHGVYAVSETNGLTVPPVWHITRQSDKVLVPLYRYVTAEKSRALILVAGLESGVRLSADVQAYMRQVPSEVTLAVSDQVEETEQGYHCLVGLAFRFEEGA